MTSTTAWTSEAWKALAEHKAEVSPPTFSVAAALADDDGRLDKLCVAFPDSATADATGDAEEDVAGIGLLADFSKHLVTERTVELFGELAAAMDFNALRAAMFAGEHVNVTEDRAVGHVALRTPEAYKCLYDDGASSSFDFAEDGAEAVGTVLAQMKAFADSVRSGTWKGATGKAIASVVNIGIGGSDLGPAMVVGALAPYAKDELDMHFVANVDPSNLTEALAKCDRETTLFIVCSKTFTTAETLANANAAKAWLLDPAGGLDDAAVAAHFVAVSTNSDGVAGFGIDPANMFAFSDWVGGRYSVWGPIGLSVMLAVGPEAFGRFLAGAHAVDEHFLTAPLASNIPFLMGTLDLWYTNFFGYTSHAVLPYDHNLGRFAAYLQQLTMESLGKGVTRDGVPLPPHLVTSGSVVFGEPGTPAQHSFMQLLHQGQVVPADFLVAASSHAAIGTQHEMLVANAVAQAEALMVGKSHDDPARAFSGNRPTTTFMYRKLTPATLGALIAFYEHAVFTVAALLGLNAYDQFGVELGKKLASAIVDDFAAASTDGHDVSTARIMQHYLALR
ncbi:glucose-6-phosphate isomerase [Thecamonas trahens ATCC 50062]|uniref:Glucose-6-phosphate isomerase n=1 Tax=Thecamonas trahens ATCC 50062 TaxID=461836 RepID=A0A0L0D8P9_THETB|nr:glucose-6-phosphate isomerase [Thecamonas trahens ATCC 50062]KNC48757.1 glucose-6-phosphate isomerase [Thecamonas trahens ATCC 50062]|eukprot:XP_013762808.1 glucose-6-phosphate isomerase [Thecamonas trahens ATCC 50062]